MVLERDKITSFFKDAHRDEGGSAIPLAAESYLREDAMTITG